MAHLGAHLGGHCGAHEGSLGHVHALPPEEIPKSIGGRPSTIRRVGVGRPVVSMTVELDYEIAISYEVLP